jgi:hypothetical protein
LEVIVEAQTGTPAEPIAGGVAASPSAGMASGSGRSILKRDFIIDTFRV